MKILYISQYFPPEVGATQFRAFETAKSLIEQGHDVTVLTEFPNHPKGVLPPEYKWKLYEKADMAGIDVRRCRVYTCQEKTFIKRILFYLSFMFSAVLIGLFIRKRFDIVLATSPPFFVGLSGYLLSLVNRAKFVFEIRDLWPESAVVLGELRNSFFIKLSQWLEEFYYRKADLIVVVTKSIKETLKNRGFDGEKVIHIPNGTNPDVFLYSSSNLKSELGLEGKFVVGYAGIFGIAQGMERLCELAERMKDHSEITFLFIGEGPKKKLVEKLTTEKKLDNVTILKEVPKESIAKYISVFDMSLVPLKKCMLFEGAIPTKMFDNMGCERPILLSIEGEAKALLDEAGGGIAVEPENTEEMMNIILNLSKSPEKCRKMGENGRKFVEKHYSRRKLAKKLEERLDDLLA